MSYRLPELEAPWRWRVNMDNPSHIALWAYERNGPARGFEGALRKVLIGTVDAGVNDPDWVAGEILNLAEQSMEWGSWSIKGQENQESLTGLLGLT